MGQHEDVRHHRGMIDQSRCTECGQRWPCPGSRVLPSQYSYGNAGHESQLADDQPLKWVAGDGAWPGTDNSSARNFPGNITREGPWPDVDNVPSAEDIVRGNERINIPEARCVTLRADEVLVVVFPDFIGKQAIDAHRAHLRSILGDRFILVSGDNVMLAKVTDDQWVRPAIGGSGD